jgi:hypothetical protein
LADPIIPSGGSPDPLTLTHAYLHQLRLSTGADPAYFAGGSASVVEWVQSEGYHGGVPDYRIVQPVEVLSPRGPGRPRGGDMDQYGLAELRGEYLRQTWPVEGRYRKVREIDFAKSFHTSRKRLLARLQALEFPTWRTFTEHCRTYRPPASE